MRNIVSQQQQLFSFACNPAASMHEGWRAHLPAWGMPKALCEPLWQSRSEQGDLSRFLAERFTLDLAIPANIQQPHQRVLVLEAKPFETALMRLGSIFLHRSALHILDGARLRQLKQEFGEKHFYFMRHQAGALAPPTPPAPDIFNTWRVSKGQAILLGLAAFLNYLPPSPDLITRLCLKLMPFADEPRPPQGFALIQTHIKSVELSLQNQWEKIFSIKENHDQQN